MKYATPKTIEELETLLGFCPPHKLRQATTTLFFDYLQKTPPAELPENFNTLAEDVGFLIRFFDEADKNKKE